MNQILYTGKGDGPTSLKTILRFFSVCLILFGITFMGKGSYALYRNYTLTKEEEESKSLPTIKFEQEGNNAIIVAEHSKGISKVKYHWNDEPDEIIQGSGELSVSIDNIAIAPGTNTLYVTAVDINGRTSDASNKYSYDGIAIQYSLVDNTYIKITASDVIGLQSLTYKWNSEEPVTAYPVGADNTIIEQQIEIPAGLNTLVIDVVNIENKTLTKSKQIKGNHPPTITVQKSGDEFFITFNDE